MGFNYHGIYLRPNIEYISVLEGNTDPYIRTGMYVIADLWLLVGSSNQSVTPRREIMNLLYFQTKCSQGQTQFSFPFSEYRLEYSVMDYK